MMLAVAETRPYEPLAMTSVKWLDVPVRSIPVKDLVFTNDVRLMDVLDVLRQGDDYISYCGDRFPHVVRFEGRSYIADGNHRVAACILQGSSQVDARVLQR